jgi:short-subunit dehydrogenase
MNHENKKTRALITGHTKGIGNAIQEVLQAHGIECVGFSRSNGFDVLEKEDHIVEQAKEFDWVILNAYAGRSQTQMLEKLVQNYKNHNKKIVVITSTSGLDHCLDDNITDPFYIEYIKNKKELIRFIANIQQDLLFDRLSVYDICPDIVDTDMTKGLWTPFPRLRPRDVAESVRSVLTQEQYNINQLVLQKK